MAMILPERLAELSELAEKATEGPWKYTTWRSKGARYTRWGIGNSVGSGQVLSGRDGVRQKVDLKFIAAARAAIPELIAEVRDLQSDLRTCEIVRAAMGKVVDEAHESYQKCLAERVPADIPKRADEIADDGHCRYCAGRQNDTRLKCGRDIDDTRDDIIELVGQATIALQAERTAHAETKERADGNFASYERIKNLYSDEVNAHKRTKAENDALRQQMADLTTANKQAEADFLTEREALKQTITERRELRLERDALFDLLRRFSNMLVATGMAPDSPDSTKRVVQELNTELAAFVQPSHALERTSASLAEKLAAAEARVKALEHGQAQTVREYEALRESLGKELDQVEAERDAAREALRGQIPLFAELAGRFLKAYRGGKRGPERIPDVADFLDYFKAALSGLPAGKAEGAS